MSGIAAAGHCKPAVELDTVSITEADYCSNGFSFKRRETRVVNNETGASISDIVEWSNNGLTWTTNPPISPKPGPCQWTNTTTAISNTVTTFVAGAVVAVPSGLIPANARIVTIFNATDAAIRFTTAIGSWAIPPQATHSTTLPESSASFAGNWSVVSLSGVAGPATAGVLQAIYVDWATRTP